ncbi:division/cell wall cluster transcriptional repressor MraZ [uncultured Cohaesibacter sp.]|uniref:division/cell wall cluster transcriptional repressor MraZ n=1 Tax=uncultured Cohaesibacter sp. TaxID=1002546 RepID=UPI00292CD2E8|nr:division/cell wall cluster transcriptional repressor MraZ [uncultured Cohaesibacter sp.]
MSKFVNRLDSKGRVSIPASFRQVLARDGLETLFCSPSLELEAVDAGGKELRKKIDSHLEEFDGFTEEREMLGAALLGESEYLKIDKDGRVVLSEKIKDHTGITDSVVFVGHGYKFQIWSPERYEVYIAEATRQALALRKAMAAKRRAQREAGLEGKA